MKRLSVTTLAVIALGLCVSSRAAQAATLTLAPGSDALLTNLFLLQGAGVSASDGGDPIAPVPYQSPSVGGATGSMSFTPVGSGDQADVRFSVSLFSDSDPYVLTGS